MDRKRLIYLRYISWMFILIWEIYIVIDGISHPSRAEILVQSVGDVAYKDILWNNFYAFVLTVILFVVGLLFLSIVLMLKKSISQAMKQGLLCLGQFLLMSGTWVLTDSHFLSFLTSNTNAVALLSYFSFTVMFAFMYEFIMCMFKGDKKVYICCYLLYVLAYANIINYHHRFIERFYLIIPVYIIGFIAAMLCIYTLVKAEQRIHNFEMKTIAYGFITMIGCFVIALIGYIFGLFNQYAILYTVGILIFCLSLIISTLHLLSFTLLDHANEQAYRRLAFTDEMTGFKNKTAYIELEKQPLKDNSIFIMLDLNNLKSINDTYGHRIGDEVIVTASSYIKKHFKDCDCYRFGGDEFVVVSNSLSYSEVENTVKNIKEEMIKDNKQREVKIEFAIGIAKQMEGDSVKSLFLRADKAMYNDKNNSANSRDNNKIIQAAN